MYTSTGSNRDLLILYATETGTAEEIAERIAGESRRFHLIARCLRMDEYNEVLWRGGC